MRLNGVTMFVRKFYYVWFEEMMLYRSPLSFAVFVTSYPLKTRTNRYKMRKTQRRSVYHRGFWQIATLPIKHESTRTTLSFQKRKQFHLTPSVLRSVPRHFAGSKHTARLFSFFGNVVRRGAFVPTGMYGDFDDFISQTVD